MSEKKLYFPYSEYLKKIYGEKVYKLPVNIPVTCPNRVNGGRGCTFCAEAGTGFEALSPAVPVREQLRQTREKIEKKYNAHKFIAYFQNYTNTFLPLEDFSAYVEEAAVERDIVEIDISTRPDCVSEEYLEVLDRLRAKRGTGICLELGLQTVNYHTLKRMNRGHSLAEFIDAVLQAKAYGFQVCAHVILNYPGDGMEDAVETARILSALRVDMVKIHSLYIAKNTVLCEAYENGTISLCSKEEYMDRLIAFLCWLSPDIAVERLFGRVPERDAVFCNWGTSWWKLRDEAENEMRKRDAWQGKYFHYLGGAALKK